MSALTKPIRSPEEVRADFERRGKTIRQFAREIGVSDRIVYEVLRGRFKGRRGQAHKAAVLLGLKDGVVEE
ncbi:gp16 family phage-associated protein [Tibeticola sediminis]|uniref:Gp16 family phage-associated protein n=1 Tax=Tibeticola sediminis TaxID=1917811 RepID=A0A3N4UY23_9BURK|nr:DNA-binding protein [Tibeticola sediminis]RPE72511.1 gp16 family phage-associated protein [Tibeticola sediminis]